ncbi:hypothetical protein ACOMHN_047294 [Nucella lapillus]
MDYSERWARVLLKPHASQELQRSRSLRGRTSSLVRLFSHTRSQDDGDSTAACDMPRPPVRPRDVCV